MHNWRFIKWRHHHTEIYCFTATMRKSLRRIQYLWWGTVGLQYHYKQCLDKILRGIIVIINTVIHLRIVIMVLIIYCILFIHLLYLLLQLKFSVVFLGYLFTNITKKHNLWFIIYGLLFSSKLRKKSHNSCVCYDDDDDEEEESPAIWHQQHNMNISHCISVYYYYIGINNTRLLLLIIIITSRKWPYISEVFLG